MNIISGGFYDGLMLYAHALNESLADSQGRLSREGVTKRMWNRTYYGEPLHHVCLGKVSSKLYMLLILIHKGCNVFYCSLIWHM